MIFFTAGNDNNASNEKRGDDKSKSTGNRKSKGQSGDYCISPEISADNVSKMKQFIHTCKTLHDYGKKLTAALVKQKGEESVINF